MAKSKTQVIAITEEPTTVAETIVEVVTKPTIDFNYDVLLQEHKSKSGIIRFLAAKGFERGAIAKYMGIKYQFVRNVLITPVKKQG